MSLGYTTDENGHEYMATTHIATRIRQLDVDLQLSVNCDLSYPLNSPHNQGFHVKVVDQSDGLIAEFNLNSAETEQQVIEAVKARFEISDHYQVIAPKNAQTGDTFAFNHHEIYNRTAIDNKAYADWDDDLEEIDDHAEQVADVTLNDQLRWQI